MRKGFKNLTYGLLAAALLSGSAFAAGPTIDGLPTVIITDKMTEAEVGANTATPFDYMATDTQNIYRFTDAFTLANYVTLAADDPGFPTTGKANVNYLFTESDMSSVQKTGGERTIQINEQFAFDAAAAPLAAEIATANQDVVAAGDLDFRNAAANSDDVPQAVPGITLPAEALITMFISSDDAAVDPAVDINTFQVITTNEATYLSDALGPAYVSGVIEVARYGQFDNWNCYATNFVWDPLVLPPSDAHYKATTPATIVPTPVTLAYTSSIDATAKTIDAAPVGTNTLNIQTSANPALAAGATVASQFAFWQSGSRDMPESLVPGVQVTKGKMYLVRWQLATNVLASNTTALQAQKDVRLSMGDQGKELLGQSIDEIGNSNPAPYHLDSVSRLHNAFFFAHADGRMGLRFDGYDFHDSAGSLNVTLDEVIVYEVDRTTLTGENIVLNNGAATVSLAAGEAAPPATGLEAFTYYASTPATGVWAVSENASGVTGAGMRTITTTGSNADRLVASSANTTSTGNTHWSWEAAGEGIRTFVSPTTPWTEEVMVPNNKWVVMDVWMSTPDTNTNLNLPDARIQLNGFAKGRNAQFEFNPGTVPAEAVVTQFPLALQAASRRYTCAMDPQLRGTTDTLGIRPLILGQFYDGYVLQGPPVVTVLDTNHGTIHINRVVVTLYDPPTLP